MTDARWVLVSEGLDGESRCSVSAVRALAAEGYRAAVTVSGGLSLAAASRFCARRIPVPAADTPGYAAAIRAELEAGGYLTVFPTSDAALLALDAPVQNLLDKGACTERARDVGIPVAPTTLFASGHELVAAAGELSYPLVVKPTLKRYAAARVDQPAALPLVIRDDGPVLVQPYLEDGLHAVAGLMWRGRLLAAAHMRYVRIWPLPCGTVASAMTVEPAADLEDALTALLDGYDGLFHAEFLGPYLQDLNPRVHGTLPLAVAAGTNLVARYCDVLRGDQVSPHRARAGMFFRWIEGDMRSVSFALRHHRIGAGEVWRSLRPRRGVVHSYESFADPGPMLARLRYLPRRVRSKVRGRAQPALITAPEAS